MRAAARWRSSCGVPGDAFFILERGAFLPREKQNWDTTEVFVKNRYISKDTWYDKDNHAFQPGVHYFVGGATKMYGAALFRLRQQDFIAHRTADGMTADWPIRYEDLEPYYTQAERLYNVHGRRGDDPTDPPASAPYPYPPVSHEPRIQEIADALTRTGYHPAYAPCAVLLDEADPSNSRCIRCDTCDGFPCLVHAKADAEIIAVRPALRHRERNAAYPRSRPATRNQRKRTRGHTRDCRPQRAARRLTWATSSWCPAALPIPRACCSCQPTTAHPAGSPTAQTWSAVTTCSTTPWPWWHFLGAKTRRCFRRRSRSTTFISRAPDCAFPLGNIQMIGKSQGPMFRDDAPNFAPGFTLDEMARHAVDFWLTSEDLALPQNRITLNAQNEIQLHYEFTNVEPINRLRSKLQAMLEHMDMHPHLIPNSLYLGKHIPIAGVAHQAGTCRFGTDPKTSVLDVNCKAHELDNLYVVDTSFFPSIGAVNPSLTAIANSLRVGDHLLERLR